MPRFRDTCAPRLSPVRPLCLCVSVFALLPLAACQKPLLSPDQPRSQYDTYDAVRNQYAPQQFRDEFGRLRPNIRQRLLAKE